MKKLNQNEKINIYGNLNIQTISKKEEKNICISIENTKIKDIGDCIYEFLHKQYNDLEYNFMDNNIRIKTTKIILDNKEMVNPNSTISIYGYVIDRIGIPWNNGHKYDFKLEDLSIKEVFKSIEELYDFYISNFDTEKDYLKFIIKTVIIKD